MELIWVLGVLVGLSASSILEFAGEWHQWKAQHWRRYMSWGEEVERHRVWLQNRQYIENHNKNVDHHGYSLALNHFGDLVHFAVVLTLLLEKWRWFIHCP